MLNFICIGFAKLRGTESKQKIQNEYINRESNRRPLAFQRFRPFVHQNNNRLCFLKTVTLSQAAFNKTNTHDAQCMYEIDMARYV